MAEQRTLEDLRRELADRIGFGGAYGAGAVNAGLLNSFLRTAQKQIYSELKLTSIERVVEKTVGYEQNILQYPSDCSPESIKSISVYDHGSWRKLDRGIDNHALDIMDDYSAPLFWEGFEEIELSPKADTTYKVRIRYKSGLGRFAQDKDRCVIDADLILLLAIGNAKAHYRQPDAQSTLNQFAAALRQAKQDAPQKRVHRRRSTKVSDLDAMYNKPVK